MNLYLLPALLLPLCAYGQLVLGPCPIPPSFIENPDFEKYSGTWYVLAQTKAHPLKAASCQNVLYRRNDVGLYANFSYLGEGNQKTHVPAKVFPELGRKHPGELKLKYESFPRTFQFRILHTNYTDIALEYTCLSGVFNYTAHMTILHRLMPNDHKDVNTLVKHYNLQPHVNSNFIDNMKLVNHENCY